ncbi:MAG: DMT family transporter [Eubacteriales bacterium]|nr:DMT family transporter [Eubacteriales bacterium]
MKHIKKETLGTYGLIFVALFWGLGFPALKVVSDTIPTFYLIGLRFFMAAVLLCILFFRRLKEINKALISSAFLLSIFLFLCYVCATLGIKYTTSAKASFFSCLGLLVIPVILRLFYKEKISNRVTISILICTAGLFMISYTSGMGFYLSAGDLICMGCSVTGAAHVVITGRVAKNQDPAMLATVQLLFISVWSFAAAIFLEDFPETITPFHWSVMVFLSVFCTAAAFVLLCACQRYISSARAGVILSIEPVSGALFSAFLLGDQLGVNGIIGGAMIFSGMIYMELGESKRTDSNVVTYVSPNKADLSLCQTCVSLSQTDSHSQPDVHLSQIKENTPSQEHQE